MRCVEFLSTELRNALSKMGYRVHENKLKWGIELVVEGKNNITTVGIYNSSDDTDKVTIEISGLSNPTDYTVDIVDCRCLNGRIYDCIDEILATLKSFHR